MEQSRIDLTQAEWQVMECLWEQAPRTGREAAEYMARRTGWSRSTTLTLLQRLEDEMADRLAIRRAVARSQGNIAAAARLLGISRPTLYDLLKNHGIQI